MDSSLMKQCICVLFVVTGLFLADRSTAQPGAKSWGMITNDARMAIALPAAGSEVRSNQPVVVLVSVTNLATGRAISFHEWAASWVDSTFRFEVISPSGENLSPIPQRGLHGSGKFVSLQPGEMYEHEFRLSDTCSFDEIGTYTIVAKRNIGSVGQPCWMISNSLRISVVPGEWKPQGTNAPPTGF
jgi:hypothetical protein